MATKAIPPFRLGTKQLFLPKFGIALLRKGGQLPNYATFKVPLRFNKLDIRDYLLNAYNVAILNVRSQLKPRKPYRLKNRRLIRPLPSKIMTVEMRQPFVWPKKPEDITPWVSKGDQVRNEILKKKYDPMKELEEIKTFSLRDERRPDKSKIALRKHAEELLEAGSWKNGEELDPKFLKPKYRLAQKNK